MSRTPKNRLVQRAPNFFGFEPIGIRGPKGADVTLLVEEYEAIRLCDYELLTQAEAAQMMNISRPTFTRVYEGARRKIALALAETCTILISGGKSVIDNIWYRCDSCKVSFSESTAGRKRCPLCTSMDITELV